MSSKVVILLYSNLIRVCPVQVWLAIIQMIMTGDALSPGIRI